MKGTNVNNSTPVQATNATVPSTAAEDRPPSDLDDYRSAHLLTEEEAEELNRQDSSNGSVDCDPDGDDDRDFIVNLLEPLRRSAGKPRVAEKTPNNVFYFSHLHRIFPDSTFIHMVRDGRDVVSSLLTMNSLPTDKTMPAGPTSMASST